jgi:hypothetical protein
MKPRKKTTSLVHAVDREYQVIESLGDRERRCTICDGKKEIVFENEYSRICKECMDELRNREGETL